MKKFLVFFFSLLCFINPLNAVSSNEVDYDIVDYIVDAKLDISGNMTIKEVIAVEGTYNGYIRDLVYKNDNLKGFNKEDIDFSNSSIYNATDIEVLNVGVVNYSGKLNFDVFNKEVKKSLKCSYRSNCYMPSNINNGISLKMFNETNNGITYFYIEYILANAVVMHEDVAEIYYSFIGDMFDDFIENYQLRVVLPNKTDGDVRVWAHGPLNGEVKILTSENEDVKLGGYLTINELDRNTPVDIRMVFPKELISVDHPYLKKSGLVALDKILDVEMKRAEEANHLREIARLKVFLVYLFTGIYFILTLGLMIFIYIKYDKERKTVFQNEYNREFIEDYDVTVIEYLFDRHITEKAFSTSILNMIYKKNISFESIDKKDYKFTKVSSDGLDEAEDIIMDIIFNDAGDGNSVTLGEIKKYAKKVNGTSSPFLNKYNKWQRKVMNNGIMENFYENIVGVKVFGIFYTIIGFVIFSFHLSYGLFSYLTILLFVLNIVFIIYIIVFRKKTQKGAEHYAKWNAFKKFLLDFGRFDEKELPEIVLWERYLVYANIFGIADKVSKTMKIKFNSLGYDANMSNGEVLFNYMIWSNLNSSINSTVRSSISAANISVAKVASSSNSSGRGFGGGFSGGGGFGGGGGGGRGF